MDDATTTENTSFDSVIPRESFESVANIMEYEKGGDTIDTELAEFRKESKSKQAEINEEIEENIETENEVEENGKENVSGDGFSFDDLGDPEPYEGNEFGEEEDGEIEPEEALEDFFSSAEFIIFVIELIIVWATNFYLKQHQLDSIGIEEFKKTAREQKTLVKAWAKILRKHSVKIGAEFELLFAMGSTYGMKMQGIVVRQKERKERKDAKIEKNSIKRVVLPPENYSETKPKKTKVNKENFRLNEDEEIEEAVEEVVIEKKGGGAFNLLKN